MIRRRSFFKTILGAIAGVALAQKIALESVSAELVTIEKPLPCSGDLNPAWESAPYETCIIWQGSPTEMERMMVDGAVERWTFSDGEFKEVPKHL